jgi:hypothetical protein
MISHGDKEAFGQGYGKGPGASDTGWEPNDLGFGYSVSKDPDGADPKESGERPLSQRRKDHSTTKVRKGSRLAAYDGGTGGPSDDMGPAMEPEDEGPVSVEAPPAPAPPPPSTIKYCPYCSSAGVVGRSDGSISCSYCSQCFSVEQRNPFPFMPGEEPGVAGEAPVGDGAPFGDDQDPGAGDEDPDASEGDTEAEEDGDWPTDDGDEDDGDDDGSEAAGADDDVPPQFRRKSFRTREGAVLSRRNYLRRVAFVVSRDPYVTMAEMERRRSGDSLSVDRA